MNRSTGLASKSLRATLRTAGRVVRPAVSRLREAGRTEQERRAHGWIASGADRTLRLDYDLTEDAVVLDVGGYEGQWASDIFARYRCRIHVFEPVAHHADDIASRFSRNPMIHVHRFGLAGSDATVVISLAADSSSVLASRRTGASEQIRLVAIDTFLDDSQIMAVDLMKINIEGGEYELLEAVLEKGLTARFRDIQVQFHDFFPGARQRMLAIRERLRATHDATYQVDFVWENWRRR